MGGVLFLVRLKITLLLYLEMKMLHYGGVQVSASFHLKFEICGLHVQFEISLL